MDAANVHRQERISWTIRGCNRSTSNTTISTPAGGCNFALVDQGRRSTSSPRPHCVLACRTAQQHPRAGARHRRLHLRGSRPVATYPMGLDSGGEQRSLIMNNHFSLPDRGGQLLFNDRDSHRPHRRSRLSATRHRGGVDFVGSRRTTVSLWRVAKGKRRQDCEPRHCSWIADSPTEAGRSFANTLTAQGYSVTTINNADHAWSNGRGTGETIHFRHHSGTHAGSQFGKATSLLKRVARIKIPVTVAL